MRKTISILLVDDHSSIIDAYSNFLTQYKSVNHQYNIKILTAESCDSAIEVIKLKKKEKNGGIDIAFIDMRLPQSKTGQYNSGEELSLYLKEVFPEVKIIIITGHYETLILSGVLQNVNPNAMLLKGDIESKIIFEALTKVINNEPYYSLSVLNIIRKKLSSNTILEKVDKQILYELWKGTKTKDLVNYVPLSLGAIEKRKRNLRAKVGAKSKDDSLLIDLVLKDGFR